MLRLTELRIPATATPEPNQNRYSMSNSSYHVSTSENDSFEEDQAAQQEPQFGVIDIVEAFTAMRHEWRGQTKETRQLAEQIQGAVATLEDLEAKLADRLPESIPANEDARKLAQLVADIDHQLTRAAGAIEQAETNRRAGEMEQADAIQRCVSGMSAWARWFARPLLDILAEQQPGRDQIAESPAVEGLNLLLARLRRSMKELQFERVDTLGEPFDANLMTAIGTIESTEHPSGHVAEQLTPGYRWQEQVLSFAEVRVAQ